MFILTSTKFCLFIIYIFYQERMDFVLLPCPSSQYSNYYKAEVQILLYFLSEHYATFCGGFWRELIESSGNDVKEYYFPNQKYSFLNVKYLKDKNIGCTC